MLVLSVPGASKKLIGSATSVTHLQDDESAQERWRQYTSASGMIDAYKAGHGLGWTTNGVFISMGDQLSIDSGLLDIFISLGIVGGSLFLFTLLALLAQGWHIARSTRDPMAYGEFAAALYGHRPAAVWRRANLRTRHLSVSLTRAAPGASIGGASEAAREICTGCSRGSRRMT